MSDLCCIVAVMVTLMGACQQRERHSNFLSYLTGAGFVLRCTVTIDSVLANSKTQNAFLFPVHTMLRHDCPLAVKPASTPTRLVHKKAWSDSLSIDMLLSAVSVLVVAQLSSELPEGLMNYPVNVGGVIIIIGTGRFSICVGCCVESLLVCFCVS
jgi:hypothetical protein